jgi:hypothetical protein
MNRKILYLIIILSLSGCNRSDRVISRRTYTMRNIARQETVKGVPKQRHTTKIFKMILKGMKQKKERIEQDELKSIRAIEYKERAQEYIKVGNYDRASVELWKAQVIDPYFIAAAEYKKLAVEGVLKERLKKADKFQRRVILTEMILFIYEEIRRNGIKNSLIGELKFRAFNNGVPINIKVPIKFWLNDDVEDFLRRNTIELGGSIKDNPNEYAQKGFKFKLTDDKKANELFCNLISNTKFYYVVKFKDFRGRILNKERQYEIPVFFRYDGFSGEIFVVCEPLTIKRKYTLTSAKAHRVEELEIIVTE